MVDKLDFKVPLKELVKPILVEIEETKEPEMKEIKQLTLIWRG
jgi:hypothetical protein